ncbi:MAG: NAD(+) synthase [Christensenellales bacterium]|nr:NAD(+) synthase [Clostridiales bacterium]
MIDAKKEIENRTKWIKNLLKESGAKGVVFGASGGKDSVLVGILCKMAADNVTGIIMPCESSRNFNEDRLDALEINEKFGIETVEIDLTEIKRQFAEKLKPLCPEHSDMAYANINPRLRMIALYNYAQRKNYLVAGTGNRSERTMGYFTKWGDGACDFNPIADLTVREVYQLLRFLGVPQKIMEKAPSAGLFEGQTDEKDMGITYDEIDDYLLENKADDRVKEIIERAEKRTAHKRNNIIIYK